MMAAMIQGGCRATRALIGRFSGCAAFALALVLAQWPGRVSAAQDEFVTPPVVAEGGQLYAAHCASCHGAGLSGGQFAPSVKGAVFRAKWRAAGGDRALQDYISATMPPATSGQLGSEQYASVARFISSENGGLAEPGHAAVAPAPLAANGSTAEPASSAPTAPDLQAIFSARHVGPIPVDEPIFNDDVHSQAIQARRALLNRLTPVTDAMLSVPPDADWLAWRRTHEATSYSPLSQIDRRSVPKLSLTWSWSLPPGTNEAAPIVHDGVLFIQSGNQVQALDAANGTLLWRYERKIAPQYRGVMNSLHRNFAIYGRNLYISTADRHVVALEARSGAVVWDREVVPADQPGLLLSAGPIAVRAKIIQGTSLGPHCKGGCAIIAMDSETGRELWRLRTVAGPGEPGGDTWNGAPIDQRYGGASWVAGSYDPKSNLLYFGTGSSYLVTPLLKPRAGQPIGNNDALYTDSTLAIDPDSGRLVWHHQHLPTDVWDLDEVFERSLIRLPVGSSDRDLVVTVGKLGIIDVLDRADGSFVFAYDLGVQNLVTGIDPKSGARTIDPAKYPVANTPQHICPSAEGARNWMTTAYHPRNHVLYIPMGESCMDWIWSPSADPSASDGIDIGWSLRPRPGLQGNFGRIDAVDLVTRKTRWTRRQRAPLSSSLLVTEGGLLFMGDRDRFFQALDDRTGSLLWSVRLADVPNSSPVTYSVNGKQYIAVVTGGGGPHDSESVKFTPEIVDASPSTTLWVFSLPNAGASR